MSVRIDAAGDSLNLASQAPGALSLMAHFYLDSNRGGYQTFFALQRYTTLFFGINGLTFENYVGSALNSGTAATLNINQWYHLACTVSGTGAGGTFRSYIDGVLSQEDTSVSLPTAAQTLWIANDASTEWIDGRAAHFKYYNAELTAAEIAQEYQIIRPNRTTNLMTYLPILNGAIGSGTDYSGNGNDFSENGTLTNAAGPGVSYGGSNVYYLTASAAVSGSISGTSVLTFGESAQLSSPASLTGASILTIGESAQLVGTGRLSYSAGSAGVNFVYNSPEPSDDDYAQLSVLPTDFGGTASAAIEFSRYIWVKPDDSYGFGTVAGGGATAATNWATEDPAVPLPSNPYSGQQWYYQNWLIDGNNNTDVVNGTDSLGFYGSGRVRWLVGDGTNLLWVQASVTANAANIVDNNWHMIATVARFSGTVDTDYELWVDGAVVGGITILNNRTNFAVDYWNSWTGYPANQGNWTMGAEKLSSLNSLAHQQDFKGVVSNMAFFNDARTGAEILSDYNAGVSGLAGTENNISGLYRFDEGSGSTATDELSGGGDITFYVGAIETAPTWQAGSGGTLTFGESAQITGSSVLSGVSVVTFGESVQIGANGELSGPAPLIFGESSQILGSGTLAGPVSIIFGESSQLLGGGVLSGASPFVFDSSAQLIAASSGAISGISTLTFDESVQLGGSGLLNGTSVVTFSGSLATGQIRPGGSDSPSIWIFLDS